MRPLAKAIQKHVALVAVSASTVRGQGRGVLAVTRSFLAVMPLNPFGVRDAKAFRRALDHATLRLVARLPKPARCWGLARKCINIFLRDAFYNKVLARRFGLGASAAFYEVPLDSIVAKALRQQAVRGHLPAWPGVKHLSPSDSERYQEFGKSLARAWKLHRVHLDTYLWVEGRQDSRLPP